ncbi:cytochrome P450 [Vararia minispora EC-137]|uniref:Cytochrome P450 n=1 Tax=Vararia minispora EC-137 TaxID=1314806 RepID=A0ACB8QWT8_9AGAM|nr:cytochrome P450 [Vararia minispora EC-137]
MPYALGVVLVSTLFLAGFLLYARLSRVQHMRAFPGPPRGSLLTGNLEDMFNPLAIAFHTHVTNLYGRVVKINGFLGDIQLYISDTKALTHLYLKNADSFESDDFTVSLGMVSFGPGVFGSAGDLGKEHHRQRKLLMPIFSTPNLRNFHNIFTDLAVRFQDVFREMVMNASTGTGEVDIMPWATRLSLELIGVVGFGHSFNGLKDDKDEYAHAICRLFPTISKMQRWAPLLPLVRQHLPSAVLRWLAEAAPWEAMHEAIDIIDTGHKGALMVMEETKAIIRSAEKGSKGDTEGPNVTSTFRMLLQANAALPKESRLSESELVAQVNSILFAGTEASTVTIARILLSLSERPQLQETLRQEVLSADGFDHDRLMSLPLLDAVYKETMRAYPPVHLLPKQALKDVVLPFRLPVTRTDGSEVNEVFIPKGAICIVNIAGVNRSVDIWGPDAHEWKPERWLSPLPDSVVEAEVPTLFAHTLSFSAGRRACIGSKFAHIATKTVIARLLAEFEFKPTDHKIIWKAGVIVSPWLENGLRPSLPLYVSPLKK